MRNDHSQQEQQNTSTYQTGVTQSPKRSSGILAFLLVLTIFLGGLASGLGILNIRLLLQLNEQNRPSSPVNVDTGATGSSTTGVLPVGDSAVPSLPEDRKLELSLASVAGRPVLDSQGAYDKNIASSVEVLSSSMHRITSSSGIVLSADGYILTNAHAVTAAQRIYVQLSDGQQYRAALVGTDPLTDLAVLYIEAEGLIPAELGDPAHLQHFSSIHSSHSLREERSLPLTGGTVTDPDYTVTLGTNSVRFIQMDVGSVSGPVYNIYGQLVGLHVGGMRKLYDLRVDTGIGYAVPTDTILTVARQLVEQGYVSGRPTLGIRTVPVSGAYQNQLELPGGLWIISSTGTLQTGDILLALSGNSTTDEEALYRILFAEGIGTKLTALVYRNGQTISLTVEITDTAA